MTVWETVVFYMLCFILLYVTTAKHLSVFFLIKKAQTKKSFFCKLLYLLFFSEGIPPHVDTHSAFEDGIASISLGSQVKISHH